MRSATAALLATCLMFSVLSGVASAASGSTLRGTVIAPASMDLATIPDLVARYRADSGDVDLTTTVAPDGGFEFTAVPAGSGWVSLETSSPLFSSDAEFVVVDGVSPADVEVYAFATSALRLILPGLRGGVDEVEVTLYTGDESAEPDRADTVAVLDTDVASVLVPHVAVDTYRVSVTAAPAGERYYPGVDTFAEAEQIDTTLGRVVELMIPMGEDSSPSEAVASLAPVPPTRLFDTRPGRDEGASPVTQEIVPAGRTIEVVVAGRAGVPEQGVAGAALALTATGSNQSGYVTAFPCDQPRPTASNLNTVPVAAVTNSVVTGLSAEGTVCLYTNSTVHLLADVTGYLPTAGGYVPGTPLRLVDTRPNRPAHVPDLSGVPVRPGATRFVPFSVLPVSDADVLNLNVTAVAGRQGGHVSVYPCSSATDAAATSSVNFVAGQVVANAAMLRRSAAGMCIASSVEVDVIIDLNGTISRDRSSFFDAGNVTGRMYDTRPGRPSTFDAPRRPVGPGNELVVVADMADAATVYNVTAIAPKQAGYITAYPCGTPRPTVSNVNYVAGQTVAGLVIAPGSNAQGSRVCLYASSPVDVAVDGVGVFLPGPVD